MRNGLMKKPKPLTFQTALEAIVSADPDRDGPRPKSSSPPKPRVKKRTEASVKKSSPRAAGPRPQKNRENPSRKPKR